MLKQNGHIWDSGAVPDGSTIDILCYLVVDKTDIARCFEPDC